MNKNKLITGSFVLIAAIGLQDIPAYAQSSSDSAKDADLAELLGEGTAEKEAVPATPNTNTDAARIAPTDTAKPSEPPATSAPQTGAVQPQSVATESITSDSVAPVDNSHASEKPAPFEMPQATQAASATTLPAPESRTRANKGTIDEVVVTARRTEESMQDVPVAISALSANDLQRESVSSMQNLQGKVPSLVISTNSQMRNTETPSIRGQGAQFGAAPGVIIYFGEVPLPSDLVANNQGGPGKFFDLQNIQILKGSQGTLFGRNTTGGALLLEPHRPEENFSASFRTEGSTLTGRGIEGVINTPLIDQTLWARAGYKYFDRKGFTHDIGTGKDYDSKHYWTSRLGLTWRPADGIENYLLGYYTKNHDNGTGNVIEDINREGLNRGILGAIGLGMIPAIPDPLGVGPGCLLLNLSASSTNCGQDILDQQHARGNRKVQLSADPDDILTTGGIIDNFSYELNQDATLRNIFSYSKFKHHYRWDLDGSHAGFIDYVNPSNEPQADLHTITEELQLQGKTGDDGRLTYVVGGYFEKTQATGVSKATALFVESITQKYNQTKTSYAPFAQGTYNLGGLSDSLSDLNLTVGARYTFDKTEGFARLTQVAGGVLTTVDNPHTASVKDAALTYTVGLDYKIDNNLLYGKISRGYKTGGISVISVNPDHYTYNSEFVTNYEIGQKADFSIADVPVRLNTALYFTDYDNLQKAAIDTYLDRNNPSLLPVVGAATINAGKAQLAGFELEATIQPFEGATIVATYGYTYAAYKKFTLVVAGVTPAVDCSGQEIPVGSVSELSCVPFQSTPKNNFSLSGRYVLPIDEKWGSVEGSLTYAWNDRQYTSTNTVPSQEPGAWLASAGLFNGSIHWGKVLDSKFDLQLYGTNLANKTYRISNSNQWTFTYMRSSIYSEPRIIGLQLGYSWGE